MSRHRHTEHKYGVLRDIARHDPELHKWLTTWPWQSGEIERRLKHRLPMSVGSEAAAVNEVLLRSPRALEAFARRNPDFFALEKESPTSDKHR